MAHNHNIIDSDARFIINPLTREITNATAKTKLIQYDHNSERLSFELPRYIDAHDMSVCDKVEIHFINLASNKINKSEDVYIVDDLSVSEEADDIIVFSWLVSGNATKYEGSLSFVIRFKCLSGDKVEYAWNTAICSAITIASGIDNGEAVIAEYSDVLEAWKREIFAKFEAEFGAAIADDDGLYAAKDYTHRFVNNTAVQIAGVGEVTGAPYTSQKYKSIEIECKEGDLFEINGVADTDARLFGFIDDNRVTVSRLSINSVDRQRKPMRAIAPEGAAKLICNFLQEGFPEQYVVRLGKYTAQPPNVPIKDTSEYRYIMPKWAEMFDFSEKAYTNRLNFVGYDELYQAFHGLNEAGFIEEVNLSTDYLAANPSDAIPESYGQINNAGLYMWHVLPPATDGSTYTQKHKRAKLMILGGLHGGEKRSMWNLYFMLKDMSDRVPNRAINILRNFFDIYIIPLCNPYGIEQGTRGNASGVNLNRDFWNLCWSKTPDAGDTYNSQYETRCISWWIEQIKPDIFVDHHTSTGDNSIENGRFLAWGDSYIKSINSLIEETIIELSPAIRAEYPDIFGDYEFVYGHTQDADSYINYGMAPHFAYYKGAISCTFEVVQGVKWDGVRVIDSNDDTQQTALETIEYFCWMNFLMRFLREAVDMLNSKIRF